MKETDIPEHFNVSRAAVADWEGRARLTAGVNPKLQKRGYGFRRNPLDFWVAGPGFEPGTFGL